MELTLLVTSLHGLFFLLDYTKSTILLLLEQELDSSICYSVYSCPDPHGALRDPRLCFDVNAGALQLISLSP